MTTRTLLACALLCAIAAPAGAVTLYRCEDGNHLSYTTERKAGCTVASTSGGTAAPAAAAGTSRPKAAANPTPADFPKVSGDTQKSRDTDRKKILEQELAAEQKGLDDNRKLLAEQEAAKALPDKLQPLRDRVALHERNLTALRKEIGNLK